MNSMPYRIYAGELINLGQRKWKRSYTRVCETEYVREESVAKIIKDLKRKINHLVKEKAMLNAGIRSPQHLDGGSVEAASGIKIAFSEQGQAIDNLENSVMALIEQLQPILKVPEKAGNPCDKSAAPINHCEVASRIAKNSDQIRGVTERVHETLKKIDI